MFVVDDASAAMRDYASKGYNLVIAHGSQYGNGLPDIAKDFPSTSFAWGTAADTFSDQGIDNVFAYTVSSEQGGYVNGLMAGMLTKSGNIGIVGPFMSGNNQLYIAGFEAGVKATNASATVNVSLTGSYSDVTKASQAATTLVEAGVDVLSGTSQSVTGAIGVAKNKGLPWFSDSFDQSSLAPDTIVASQAYNWAIMVRQMVELVQSGTLGGQVLNLDLSNGGITIAFNPDYQLPADVRSAADSAIQAISDGSLKVPVTEQ